MAITIDRQGADRFTKASYSVRYGRFAEIKTKSRLPAYLYLIGFSKPGAKHPVSPRCLQRLGHCVPLSFTAFGGKIQATRFAGGR
jgi:hypothetical protein